MTIIKLKCKCGEEIPVSVGSLMGKLSAKKRQEGLKKKEKAEAGRKLAEKRWGKD